MTTNVPNIRAIAVIACVDTGRETVLDVSVHETWHAATRAYQLCVYGKRDEATGIIQWDRDACASANNFLHGVAWLISDPLALVRMHEWCTSEASYPHPTVPSVVFTTTAEVARGVGVGELRTRYGTPADAGMGDNGLCVFPLDRSDGEVAAKAPFAELLVDPPVNHDAPDAEDEMRERVCATAAALRDRMCSVLTVVAAMFTGRVKTALRGMTGSVYHALRFAVTGESVPPRSVPMFPPQDPYRRTWVDALSAITFARAYTSWWYPYNGHHQIGVMCSPAALSHVLPQIHDAIPPVAYALPVPDFLREVARALGTLVYDSPGLSYIASTLCVMSIAHRTDCARALDYLPRALAREGNVNWVDDKGGVSPHVLHLIPGGGCPTIDDFDLQCGLALPFFPVDYVGMTTMMHHYLWRDEHGHVVEQPMWMYVRVALCLSGVIRRVRASGGSSVQIGSVLHDNLWKFIHTLAHGRVSVATPILRSAGSRHPQLSSCFLQTVRSNTIQGVCQTVGDAGQLSSMGGGVGIFLGGLAASGRTDGRVGNQHPSPMYAFAQLNTNVQHITQGGRPGAVAAYLPAHHPDVLSMIKARQHAAVGALRHLFIGVMVSDLLMFRARENAMWSFFCPVECPGLDTCHGEAYEALYTKYEKEGRAKSTMPAFDVLNTVCVSTTTTGVPYVVFSCATNETSNQKNLGSVLSSNLCTEVVQVALPGTITSCTLASICLPAFVGGAFTNEARFAHARYVDAIRAACDMLHGALRETVHPLGKESADASHPIGIGLNGFADMLAMLGVSIASPTGDKEDVAARWSGELARILYMESVRESMALAKAEGSYKGFHGSPASSGLLHPHMWGARYRRINQRIHEVDARVAGDSECKDIGDVQVPISAAHMKEVDELAAQVRKGGLAFSQHVALMPTRTTAEVVGSTDTCEPFAPLTSTNNGAAGRRAFVNMRLVECLLERGVSVRRVLQHCLENSGSIQTCEDVPEDIRRLFLTTFDIRSSRVIDLAAARAPWVDQSQSMNIFLDERRAEKKAERMTQLIMRGFAKGLKTAVYYVRQLASAQPAAATTTLERHAEVETVVGGERGEVVAPTSIDEVADPIPVDGAACSVGGGECTSCVV